MKTDPPCCALLTPPGRGAIAVVGLFGNDLEQRLVPLFEPSSGALTNLDPAAIRYGRWKPTQEDVILTGKPGRIEIHCHGGQAAPSSIIHSLVAAGFVMLDQAQAAQQVARDAGFNQWQSEVLEALTLAPTERTAEVLLNQFHLAATAIAELESSAAADRGEAKHTIARALDFFNFGLHTVQPWSVIFCGKPNVGKSSLINAIVGFERAIVHSQAGTTRDIVTQQTAIAGWPVELKDTAGLRHTTNQVERLGIERSQAEIETADLVIAVFDATDIDWQVVVEFVKRNRARLIAINKVDQLSQSGLDELKQNIGRKLSAIPLSKAGFHDSIKSCSPVEVPEPLELVYCSATQRLGLADLLETISGLLVPQVPAANQLIPINQRQADWLMSLMKSVD